MTDEARLSTLDERLCFALYSSSQAIIKKYKKGLSALDMTYPQYLVYLALEPESQLSVTALGKRLFLDSGTLSPLLQRMEKNALIERHRSASDERRVMVKLTDKARRLKPQVIAIQKEVACATQLAPEHFGSLLSQLQQLNQTLRR